MRAALLAGLLALLGGARAATTPAALPADYFTREVKPLNVTPATDADNSYSDLIGPEGGQLTTLDAAGNTYTLTVPKGALGFPEQLTMTPLTALKGMPFKGGVNAGVQLEPEGTFFVKPVTLEVEFADQPNLNAITPFDYTGAGQDFTTTMLVHDPGHYVFLLNHFSGAGFANSNEAERTAELVRQPLADEERIQHSVQEQLGAERQRQLMGQDSNGLDTAAIARAMTEYEKEVIEPLSKVANQSCTVGVLYINKVLGLERQRQLLGVSSDSSLGALANALGGSIQKKCLEEEAQACYRSGDLLRFSLWYLGLERQRQLVGASSTNELDADFQKDYNACAHFEVQFNSTLKQISDADTTGVTGGFIQAKGKENYTSTLTSILPIRATIAGGITGILAGTGLPRGDQPLPYAGYTMTSTVSGGVALAQTNIGTVGVPVNCTESGTKTTPGQIAAWFLPIFDPAPPNPNAPDPALDGLSPTQKRDVIRILHNTPRYGLLAPPRQLNLIKTVLTIGVGHPTEQTVSSCDKQTHDLTTWLDAWNAQLKTIGKGSVVMVGQGTDSEPAWDLNSWQKGATAFPLKIVQDVPHHEQIEGSTYDETWHLDITVVHTPKE